MGVEGVEENGGAQRWPPVAPMACRPRAVAILRSVVLTLGFALAPGAGAQVAPTVYQVDFDDVCNGGKLLEDIHVRVVVGGGTCDPPFYHLPGYIGQTITIEFLQDPEDPTEEFLGVSNVGFTGGGEVFPSPCCGASDVSCCDAGYTIQDEQGRVAASTRSVPLVSLGLAFNGMHKIVFSGSPGWVGIGGIFFQLTAPCIDEPGDTDADGLPDVWEKCGINLADDGVTIEPCLEVPCDLDLADMGADPMRKDLFIEIDWMRAGPHSRGHWPRRVALERLRKAFLEAPVENPDLSQGIQIHLDAGPRSVMDPRTGRQWGALSRSNSLAHDNRLGTCGAKVNATCEPSIWEDFDDLKKANFEPLRAPVFRYVVIAHGLDDDLTSGLSRAFGTSDMIVSLGDWHVSGGGTPKEQGGTLMHELGHALGLHHGGNDDMNYKPNYLSVMNYSFTTKGLIYDEANGVLDYSRFSLPDLDENDLDEAVGLTGGGAVPELEGYGTRWHCAVRDSSGTFLASFPTYTLDATDSIDWSCDAVQDPPGLAEDINTGRDTPPAEFGRLDVLGLAMHDDWSNIQYQAGDIGILPGGEATAVSAAAAPTQALSDLDTRIEITESEAHALPSAFDVSVQAPLQLEVLPGVLYMLDFEVENIGDEADYYTLAPGIVGGIAMLVGAPTWVDLASGETAIVSVPVDVSELAVAGSQAEVYLEVYSVKSPAVSDSDSVLIEVVPEPSSELLAIAALLVLALRRDRPRHR